MAGKSSTVTWEGSAVKSGRPSAMKSRNVTAA
jgi:hypothetical protein